MCRVCSKCKSIFYEGHCFGDADFEKAAQVNSDTQLYKQAGNSIVVDVLENIFANLLTDYIDKKET